MLGAQHSSARNFLLTRRRTTGPLPIRIIHVENDDELGVIDDESTLRLLATSCNDPGRYFIYLGLPSRTPR